MAKVLQSVKTKANNKTAKYKLKYTYRQYNVNYTNEVKYSYSKLISLLTSKKYSYAI